MAQLTGKKVIILEKAAKPGGSAWCAVGMRIAGSKWDRDAGLPDRRHDLMREAMSHSGWKLDRWLVKKTITALGPLFDWICDFGGAEGNFEITDGPFGEHGVFFTNRPAGARGGVGRYVVNKMLEQCGMQGVDILTEHRAIDVVMDSRGAVAAVISNDPGGQTKINCKACLISTGSWICNNDLALKYAPSYGKAIKALTGHRLPQLTGDGIALGAKAGAYIDYESLCVNVLVRLPCPWLRSFWPMGRQTRRFTSTVKANAGLKRAWNSWKPPCHF